MARGGNIFLNNFIDKEVVWEPSCDTSALATGDVIAATEAITLPESGNRPINGRITGVTVLDKDDQGQNLDIVILKSNVAVGTENAAVSITDANAENILAIIPVYDWTDMINSQFGQSWPLNVPINLAYTKGNTDNNQFFAALVCRSGTPTYTASGLYIRFHFAPQT